MYDFKYTATDSAGLTDTKRVRVHIEHHVRHTLTLTIDSQQTSLAAAAQQAQGMVDNATVAWQLAHQYIPQVISQGFDASTLRAASIPSAHATALTASDGTVIHAITFELAFTIGTTVFSSPPAPPVVAPQGRRLLRAAAGTRHEAALLASSTSNDPALTATSSSSHSSSISHSGSRHSSRGAHQEARPWPAVPPTLLSHTAATLHSLLSAALPSTTTGAAPHARQAAPTPPTCDPFKHLSHPLTSEVETDDELEEDAEGGAEPSSFHAALSAAPYTRRTLLQAASSECDATPLAVQVPEGGGEVLGASASQPECQVGSAIHRLE